MSRLLVLALVMGLPSLAFAQDDDEPPGRRPIGRFAADARLAFPSVDQDPATAERLGVLEANLPGRGYGPVLGAHVYPLRMGVVTLGLGGEVMAARGSRTLEPEEEGGPDGPTVRTRFSAVSPQLSLNFGGREGWSYISGGIGWARLFSEREDAIPTTTEDTPRRKTINYGGGARWFNREHLAVSLDLRIYAVAPQAETATQPAMPRMTRMVLSAGVSFK